MIVLLDQDGVLANFEKAVLDGWRKKYPDDFFVPLEQRQSFLIEEDYPECLREKLIEIYHQPGFCLNLIPINGALEAIKKISSRHEVWICTSPLSDYENCVLEKYQWVEKYLGRDFTKKIILAKDKTMIRGHILIDDKPEIIGSLNPTEIARSLNPTWEHVIFDAPYNKNTNHKKRINWSWSNWEDIIPL